MVNTIKRFLDQWSRTDLFDNQETRDHTLLYDEQQEHFDQDMSILGDENNGSEEKVHKKAEKELRTAAEDSLKKLHVIQRGHCPHCGAHLHQHLFCAICDDCGWHTFDTPRDGPVRVHLQNTANVIEGERCYVLKTGSVLVINQDVVVAKIPSESVSWVEYLWNEDEVAKRHRQILQRLSVRCAWCTGEIDPDREGFHLVHAAFGTTQERYCFCTDECFEAFRKMYPSRVHRNCYERSCENCDLCSKRYPDSGGGMYTFMKDYLTFSGRKVKSNG